MILIFFTQIVTNDQSIIISIITPINDIVLIAAGALGSVVLNLFGKNSNNSNNNNRKVDNKE